MLIRNNDDGFIHPLGSEITSKEAYATRREMLRRWSAGAAAAGLAGWGIVRPLRKALVPSSWLRCQPTSRPFKGP